MRATLSYTLLRLLLFFAVAIILALFGVHGITLLVVALIISSIISLPLLSRLRDRMSSSLSGTGYRLPVEAGRGHQGRGPEVAPGAQRPGACWSASQPPDVSMARTACTASARLIAEVSMTSSASAGSS